MFPKTSEAAILLSGLGTPEKISENINFVLIIVTPIGESNKYGCFLHIELITACYSEWNQQQRLKSMLFLV